jgi:uncharacterized protein YcbK (DUF882 family)
MQITKNFWSSELECPCCSGLVYDQIAIDRLQILRTIINKPFNISKGGGYRCRIYNDSLENSASNSRHLYGSAFDISSKDWSGDVKWNFIHEAMKLKFSIGEYSTFFHVDQRPGSPVWFRGKY